MITHKQYKQIEEFQKSFGFESNREFLGNAKYRTLRHNLIKEEYIKETLGEIKKGDIDLVKIADGLGDTAVVVLGTLHTFDIPFKPSLINEVVSNHVDEITRIETSEDVKEQSDILYGILKRVTTLWGTYLPTVPFEEVYTEIHNSNMSKACSSMEVAYLTMKKYEKEYNDNDFRVKIQPDGRIFIYRFSDGKLLKSIDYKEANIKSILEKYNVL